MRMHSLNDDSCVSESCVAESAHKRHCGVAAISRLLNKSHCVEIAVESCVAENAHKRHCVEDCDTRVTVTDTIVTV